MTEPRELSPIKEIPVKIGGEVRLFRLDALACWEFEKETGVNWYHFQGQLYGALFEKEIEVKGKKKVLTGAHSEKLPPVSQVIAALWAGLRHQDPELAIEDVAKMARPNIMGLVEVINEALLVQGMQPDEGQAPGNELKAVESPSAGGISTASA